MNKRIIQSILIAGVVFVWGLVIYRLVSSPSEDDMQLSDNTSRPYATHTEFNFRDSALYLSYHDPFLSKSYSPSPPTEKRTSLPTAPRKKENLVEVPKITTPWPEVVYKGVISNKSRGEQLLAMVVINGREQIVRNGEIISGFEVVGITSDLISLKSPEKEVKGFGR